MLLSISERRDWKARALRARSMLSVICLVLALAAGGPSPLSAQQAAPQPAQPPQAAAPAPAPAPAPKEPEKPKEHRRIPVFVDHKGADDVGMRFAFQLKERINASPLLRLSEKPGEKRVRLRVTTVEEFKERPWIGSMYAVVWLFAENAEVLSYYLDSDVGVVAPASAADLAEKILARTDALAGQFGYLFE